eukprot:TRINITY_DN16599_c0_g1_i1.p1 TRINITY_DN16599_c0_g1~~TRINITY_DN16599_c0_g1_i1.p1  ORF type:complete len:585 (-),score=82.29 TRINITY_DN16599_c0_g1_i1:60-1790(-)
MSILGTVQRISQATPSITDATNQLDHEMHAAIRVGFIGASTADVVNATVRDFLMPGVSCVVELSSSTTPQLVWSFDGYTAVDPLEYDTNWKVLQRITYLKKKMTDIATALQRPNTVRKLEIHYPFQNPFAQKVVLVQMPMPGSAPCDIVFESVDVASMVPQDNNLTLLQVNNRQFSTPVIQPYKALMTYFTSMTSPETQAFDDCVAQMQAAITKQANEARTTRMKQITEAERVLSQHIDHVYRLLYAIRNQKTSFEQNTPTTPPSLKLSDAIQRSGSGLSSRSESSQPVSLPSPKVESIESVDLTPSHSWDFSAHQPQSPVTTNFHRSMSCPTAMFQAQLNMWRTQLYPTGGDEMQIPSMLQHQDAYIPEVVKQQQQEMSKLRDLQSQQDERYIPKVLSSDRVLPNAAMEGNIANLLGVNDQYKPVVLEAEPTPLHQDDYIPEVLKSKEEVPAGSVPVPTPSTSNNPPLPPNNYVPNILKGDTAVPPEPHWEPPTTTWQPPADDWKPPQPTWTPPQDTFKAATSTAGHVPVPNKTYIPAIFELEKAWKPPVEAWTPPSEQYTPKPNRYVPKNLPQQ